MHFQHLPLRGYSMEECLVIQEFEVGIHATQRGPDRASQQSRRAAHIGRDGAAGISGRLQTKVDTVRRSPSHLQGSFDGPAECHLYLRTAFAAGLHVSGVCSAIFDGEALQTPRSLLRSFHELAQTRGIVLAGRYSQNALQHP